METIAHLLMPAMVEYAHLELQLPAQLKINATKPVFATQAQETAPTQCHPTLSPVTTATNALRQILAPMESVLDPIQ
jgi:hypothetical protein